MTRLVVSIDPGVSNLGLAGISVNEDFSIIKLEFKKTFNVSINGKLDPDILFTTLEDEIDSLVSLMERRYDNKIQTLWVIEYQPPLNTRSNPGLVRNNTFVEAFIHSWLVSNGRKLKVVAPSSVKKRFNFPKRHDQYQSNKQFAIKTAKDLVNEQHLNDHIADCILNGLYGLGY